MKTEVLAGLAYFANPEDLIPDQVPALGFLDDAIMVKFVEEEFKHELWGYRKFRGLRDSPEQRPWTTLGSDRLRQRLEADRRRIRARDRGAQGQGRREAEDGALLRLVSRPPTPSARDPKAPGCRGSWSSTTRKPSSRR